MSTITRRESISLLGASALVLSASEVMAAGLPNPQPADWSDPLFVEPFVDVDEWRDSPVRHRYVHGGFKGTDTLFSIYFPPNEQYQGRFFHPVPAMNGSEKVAQLSPGQLFSVNVTQENTAIGFAAASGAYLVESNQGSKTKYPTDDRSITGYRASAAVAKYSRTLAAKMYGAHRTYGYAYGGSGGAYKTLSFAQNTVGIWDGFLPYVPGSPNAAPSSFTIQAHALRILKDKLPAIIDAVDPGSSGDMYAGLNAEEHAALLEATRLGIPPRIWFYHEQLGYGPLGGLIDDIVKLDSDYFTHDFWNVAGYLGANAPQSLKQARIRRHRTTITRIVMSDEAKKMGTFRVTSAAVGTNIIPAAFVLADMPSGELKGATITFRSGGAAGQKISASGEAGQLVPIDIGPYAFPYMKDVKIGDEIEIDNSVYIAAQTYHRHQVPSADYHAWDQFRGADGKPIYPQRPMLIGPWIAERASGSVPNAHFDGKMIICASMVDEYAYAWNADWYHTKVKEFLGPKFNDRFRFYYTDHAMHGAPPPGPIRTRIVQYTTVLQQALRDLSDWVEHGVAPPPSTRYEVSDGQVKLPATAAERQGLQPVVSLTANGGARAESGTGTAVTFVATVEVPPHTGKVVRAEWDFEGDGSFPVIGEVKHADAFGARASVTATHSFSKAGIYFPAVRVASQRRPDDTVYAQIENLARVRVVVT